MPFVFYLLFRRLVLFIFLPVWPVLAIKYFGSNNHERDSIKGYPLPFKKYFSWLSKWIYQNVTQRSFISLNMLDLNGWTVCYLETNSWRKIYYWGRNPKFWQLPTLPKQHTSGQCFSKHIILLDILGNVLYPYTLFFMYPWLGGGHLYFAPQVT